MLSTSARWKTRTLASCLCGSSAGWCLSCPYSSSRRRRSAQGNENKITRGAGQNEPRHHTVQQGGGAVKRQGTPSIGTEAQHIAQQQQHQRMTYDITSARNLISIPQPQDVQELDTPLSCAVLARTTQGRGRVSQGHRRIQADAGRSGTFTGRTEIEVLANADDEHTCRILLRLWVLIDRLPPVRAGDAALWNACTRSAPSGRRHGGSNGAGTHQDG